VKLQHIIFVGVGLANNPYQKPTIEVQNPPATQPNLQQVQELRHISINGFNTGDFPTKRYMQKLCVQD
jgi:hypothetical protein